MPFSPCFPIDTLDSGWKFALNEAVAKGFIFGKDIVISFGPYGSIYTTQYYPGTDSPMLLGGSLLAVAFAASLVCLYDGTKRLAAACLAAFLVFTQRDTQFFAIPLITLLLVCRISLPAGNVKRVVPTLPICFSLALLVMSLSLMLLVKATFAIASGLVMVISCVLLFARGYRGLAIGGGVLFGLAIAVFWVLSGQPLGSLPNFFLAQGPIVSGYAAAMSLGGSKWQIAAFVAGCLLIALLNIWRLKSADIADHLFYAATAILLFLAYKEAFIRDNDVHPMVAAGMLGVVSWIVFLSAKGLVPTMSLAVGMLVWLFGANLKNRVQSQMCLLSQAFFNSVSQLHCRVKSPRLGRRSISGRPSSAVLSRCCLSRRIST